MKKLRFLVCVCAACAAVAGTAAPGSADPIGLCPDGYVATSAALDPSADKNANGVICAKGPQGNGHFNTKDDKRSRPDDIVDDII